MLFSVSAISVPVKLVGEDINPLTLLDNVRPDILLCVTHNVQYAENITSSLHVTAENNFLTTGSCWRRDIQKCLT